MFLLTWTYLDIMLHYNLKLYMYFVLDGWPDDGGSIAWPVETWHFLPIKNYQTNWLYLFNQFIHLSSIDPIR